MHARAIILAIVVTLTLCGGVPLVTCAWWPRARPGPAVVHTIIDGSNRLHACFALECGPGVVHLWGSRLPDQRTPPLKASRRRKNEQARALLPDWSIIARESLPGLFRPSATVGRQFVRELGLGWPMTWIVLKGPDGRSFPRRWWDATGARIVPSGLAVNAGIGALCGVALLLTERGVRRILGALGWRRGACMRCGYDLRGLATPRCPECGRSAASFRMRRLASVIGASVESKSISCHRVPLWELGVLP